MLYLHTQMHRRHSSDRRYFILKFSYSTCVFVENLYKRKDFSLSWWCARGCTQRRNVKLDHALWRKFCRKQSNECFTIKDSFSKSEQWRTSISMKWRQFSHSIAIDYGNHCFSSQRFWIFERILSGSVLL